MVLINIFAPSKRQNYVNPFSNNYPCGGARQKTTDVRMDCAYTKQEKAFLTINERGFFN